MKIGAYILAIILFFGRANTSVAKPHQNLGGIHPDRLRVLSPDGKFELWNEDDIFVINPPGVDGSFFSDDVPELDSFMEHVARYAVWNPNSQMIAVCVESGKFTEDTFVLLPHGQDGWRYIGLPYDDPNAWVIPLRWIDSDTLVIQISGPRHTKAEPDSRFYIYEMTVRYDRKQDRFVKVSSSQKTFPDRDDN
jgi:hypothetical protein